MANFDYGRSRVFEFAAVLHCDDGYGSFPRKVGNMNFASAS